MQRILRRSRRAPLAPSHSLALLLGALSALVPLAVDMYLPCFDSMAATFAVTNAQVALSLSSFFVGMFIGQLFWGPISDKFGRKTPLLLGLFGYIVASVGCGLAPNLAWLIPLRCAQAFGGCAGMVLSRAMVRDCFRKERAVHMLSLLMLVQGLAPMVGPTLGGLVQSTLGWRGVFAILSLAGVVLWYVCWRFVPETNQTPRRDLSVRRAAAGYFELLGDRAFLAYALTGSLVSAGMFAYITCSPFVFMDLFGLSANAYGLVFAGNAVGLMIAGQLNRVLVMRIGMDATLRWALRFGALMALILLQSSWRALQPAVFLPTLTLFLTSLGFVWPNVSAGALAAQGHRAGTAAATHGAIHWGVACVASFVAGIWHDGTALPLAGVIALSSLCGNIAYVCLSQKPTAAPRSA